VPADGVPEAAAPEPWVILSAADAETLRSTEALRRWLLRFHIHYQQPQVRLFAHVRNTVAASGPSLHFPTLSLTSSSGCVGMSPLAVWLRLQHGSLLRYPQPAMLGGSTSYSRVLVGDMSSAALSASASPAAPPKDWVALKDHEQLSWRAIETGLRALTSQSFEAGSLTLHLKHGSQHPAMKLAQVPRDEGLERVWLVVYACLDKLTELITYDNLRAEAMGDPASRNTVFVLAPAACLQESDLTQRLQASIRKLPSNCKVLNLLLIVAQQTQQVAGSRLSGAPEPLAPDHGTLPASQVLESCPYLSRVLQEATAAPREHSRVKFKKWLQRDPSQPLPQWEFNIHSFICETENGRLLHLQVAADLQVHAPDANVRGACRLLSVLKVSPVCGVTCLLRHVAFSIDRVKERNVLVLWVNKLPDTLDPTFSEAVERHVQATSYTRVLLVADEVMADQQQAENVRDVLLPLALRLKLSICVLASMLLGPQAPSRMVHQGRALAVSPVLQPQDLGALTGALKDVFSDDASACTALDDALSSAQAAFKRKEDAMGRRNAQEEEDTLEKYLPDEWHAHIFVFCLAACSGQYRPAINWVAALRQRIEAGPEHMRAFARVLAFDAAFSYRPSRLWLRQPLGLPFALVRDRSDASVSFRCLFQKNLPEDSVPHSFRCLHPFLARLYLAAPPTPPAPRVTSPIGASSAAAASAAASAGFVPAVGDTAAPSVFERLDWTQSDLGLAALERCWSLVADALNDNATIMSTERDGAARAVLIDRAKGLSRGAGSASRSELQVDCSMFSRLLLVLLASDPPVAPVARQWATAPSAPVLKMDERRLKLVEAVVEQVRRQQPIFEVHCGVLLSRV